MKKQLKTIILAAFLLISNAIVGNAQEPTPQFNPVGTWKITAIENVDIQCPFLPLPDFITDDNFDLAGSEYEVVETSDGLLNIIDNTDSQRYTETSRQPPNRYTFELQYQDTDDDITINITDTVTLILSSDEDAIGIGTLNYEDRPCQATYTVNVKKRPILTGLSLSAGQLQPNFSSEITQYAATVGSDVTQVSIIATADSNTHIITFDGSQSNIVPLNIGSNTITIRVTSADDIATSSYTLQVSRPRPILTGLSLSAGQLQPNFSSEITQYAATVGSDVTQVSITATANSNTHIITFNGSHRNIVLLNIGSNTITIRVTSADGIATSIYTLQVSRPRPILTGLSLSAGQLQPNFRSGIAQYAATVGSDVTQVSIIATADSNTHTITFNSSQSNIVLLNVGNNPIMIRITTADGIATSIYTLEVSRPRPVLTGLSLSAGQLQPNFRSGIAQYASTVGSDVTQVSITATADSNTHTISFNGSQSNIVPLNIGSNTITIRVTSADGKATASYTLRVSRPRPVLTGLSLSAGQIQPNFRSEITQYAATVGSDVTQVSITATADSNTHTITFNGRRSNIVQLNVGDNTITIRVITAGDRTTASYTLQVSRPRPILTGLSLSAGQLQPNFRSGIAQYAATVGSDVTQVSITATADSNTHIISFNGSQSNIVPLNVGNNTITIRVATADGIATSIYTLEVSRPRPALTGLSLSAGQIQPSFNPKITQYTAIVSNDMQRIDITATANGNTHALTFNSSQSNIVPLNVGDNTIAIRVTTADRMAMADYNLAIRRLSTATLTGLTAEVNSQLLTLRPNFSTIVLDYKASIESTMTRLILRPTADTGRMIRIRYTPQEGTAIDQSISSGNSISIMPFSYGENNIYIDVTHKGAMESYVLHVLLGLRVRAKLFLEGPLR